MDIFSICEKLSSRMKNNFPKYDVMIDELDTEQALKVLTQTDPALLMEIVKSIQSANKS